MIKGFWVGVRIFLAICFAMAAPASFAQETPAKAFAATWGVISIDGASPSELSFGTRLTIQGNGDFSGRSGCNNFRGVAKISGRNAQFSVRFMTLVYCARNHEHEKKFFAALRRARSIRVVGSRLLLLSRSGATVIELARE